MAAKCNIPARVERVGRRVESRSESKDEVGMAGAKLAAKCNIPARVRDEDVKVKYPAAVGERTEGVEAIPEGVVERFVVRMLA